MHTCELMGHKWRRCVVNFGVDNQAFKSSAEKGWSHAARLQELTRKLFALQIDGDYVLQFFWLASADNKYADDLSRNREDEFLRTARLDGFWPAGVTPVRLSGAGLVRQLGAGYSSNNLRDGPSAGAIAMRASITYPRADLYTGLPPALAPRLDEVLDNRLRPSSLRTVDTAVKWWRRRRATSTSTARDWPALRLHAYHGSKSLRMGS